MVWTNSPADKVGIKPGLFLIAVNGTNVVSKSVVEVMSMVRGPVGEVVKLELADDGAEFGWTDSMRCFRLARDLKSACL
jgi:C-terminal processing protease CtpA/Prc